MSWLQKSDEELTAWANTPGMEDYKHVIRGIIREKQHVLSPQEERLLAMGGEVSATAKNVFSMLNDADLRFPKVKLPNGEEVEITHGSYRLLMDNPDRNVRKDTYEKMYGVYQQHINSIAAMYGGSVKKDVYYATVRSYPSCIEAKLQGIDVPLAVYDSLIETVRKNIPVMERYLNLRKKCLGVDELYMYDVYTPLIEGVETKLSYEDAKQLVYEGLAPLGKEYQAMLKQAYEQGWIDVEENRGKTSGAYCWGVYGVHPYVLLNYQEDLDYAFTIAHELGHAMHSYYSDKNNSYLNAGYEIFVAEVASTVNEVLLTKHILNTTQDENIKKYIVNNYLEQFRTTVFRQTMFAEFEKISHAMAERGEALTVESMNEQYAQLNAYYYPGVTQDELIKMEWARIPHFYNSFYVYQYATGFSAAVAIAEGILKGNSPADYLEFLKTGGRDYPIELLKIAGVDLSTPAPVQACMEAFEGALNQLENMLK
ncbi:oligoendopeptidase F [Clostridia bacterium OttesenSCG-928-F22]|nr:oligoendopeptidase F [Clostridia bacterium OttesenSCG-928-F22]